MLNQMLGFLGGCVRLINMKLHLPGFVPAPINGKACHFLPCHVARSCRRLPNVHEYGFGPVLEPTLNQVPGFSGGCVRLINTMFYVPGYVLMPVNGKM